ncbi:MAG TPA: peroxidase-related enzyme [Terracidiphilus sp.]|nr:peroxidase-related enzyme [Terracidiphilus sp.]
MTSEVSPKVEQMETPERHRAAPSSMNLPLVEESTASGEVRALFARYRERIARTDLPGIVLCFATNPALLKGMLEIAENLLFGESLLSRRHKEMLATYVSWRNACPYCADSHAAALGAQGGSPEIVCDLQNNDLNSQLFTSAEIALLKFAGKVNANSHATTRVDVEAAIQEGWTEAQVAEAVHIAALFAAFNRIANGFGLPSPYPDGL